MLSIAEHLPRFRSIPVNVVDLTRVQQILELSVDALPLPTSAFWVYEHQQRPTTASGGKGQNLHSFIHIHLQVGPLF
jgi:hypothetical protein